MNEPRRPDLSSVRATGPQPAPDAGRDPAELPSAAPATAPPPPSHSDDPYAGLVSRAGVSSDIPTTIRLDPTIRARIDEIKKETGATIKSIIENAIIRTYGTGK